MTAPQVAARRLTSEVVTRVLIADDDTVVRDVVRRYLERDGLEVSIARDGSEALRLLGSQRIDVAVLDVMMPGPDGLTLCRSLRQRGDYGVPVILLTALGEEDDRIAGLEAGADDYLTKPFSPRTGAAGPVGAAARAGAGGRGAARDHRRRPHRVDGRPLGDSQRSPVSLTNREFDLLLFFLTHTDTVFSREELLKQVWRWASATCRRSPCTSSGCGPSSATSTGCRPSGARATCGPGTAVRGD